MAVFRDRLRAVPSSAQKWMKRRGIPEVTGETDSVVTPVGGHCMAQAATAMPLRLPKSSLAATGPAGGGINQLGQP